MLDVMYVITIQNCTDVLLHKAMIGNTDEHLIYLTRQLQEKEPPKATQNSVHIRAMPNSLQYKTQTEGEQTGQHPRSQCEMEQIHVWWVYFPGAT